MDEKNMERLCRKRGNQRLARKDSRADIYIQIWLTFSLFLIHFYMEALFEMSFCMEASMLLMTYISCLISILQGNIL